MAYCIVVMKKHGELDRLFATTTDDIEEAITQVKNMLELPLEIEYDEPSGWCDGEYNFEEIYIDECTELCY